MVDSDRISLNLQACQCMSEVTEMCDKLPKCGVSVLFCFLFCFLSSVHRDWQIVVFIQNAAAMLSFLATLLVTSSIGLPFSSRSGTSFLSSPVRSFISYFFPTYEICYLKTVIFTITVNHASLHLLYSAYLSKHLCVFPMLPLLCL